MANFGDARADPFYELVRHANSTHTQKAKLNIVLSAVKDVIYERRNASDRANAKCISNTEYFAALMTGLEASTGAHRSELCNLLSMVLPYTPPSVLRAKFTAIRTCIMRILADLTQNEGQKNEAFLLRYATICLGHVLVAQEPSAETWARLDILEPFQFIMGLAMNQEARPKVRKAARDAIISILQLHREHRCEALSTLIETFSRSVFAASQNGEDERKLLILIGFLKFVLPVMDRKAFASLVQNFCRCMDSHTKSLRLVALDALSSLAETDEAKWSQDACANVLNSLLSAHELSAQAVEEANFAIRLYEICLNRLFASNEVQALQFHPRVISSLCSYIASEDDQMQEKSVHAIYIVLTTCLHLPLTEDSQQSVNVSRIQSSLQSLLQMRFQSAWSHVFELFAELFTFYGEASSCVFEELLRESSKLYQTVHAPISMRKDPKTSDGHEQSWKRACAKFFTSAVAAIGPKRFLQILPIEDEKNVILEQRAWMLSILRDGMTLFPCDLSVFFDPILEYARNCEAKARFPNTKASQVNRLQSHIIELWQLFPCVCVRPTDIDPNFSKIAKILANALRDERYPELPNIVCRGLESLLTAVGALAPKTVASEDMITEDTSASKSEIANARVVLSKYAKRFLPILVQIADKLVFEKDSATAQTVLRTVKGFASLGDRAMIDELFKSLLQKILISQTELTQLSAKDDTRLSSETLQLRQTQMAHLYLSTALIGTVETENIQFLYRVVKPFLLSDSDASMQKCAYAVLAAICEQHLPFLQQNENLEDMIGTITKSLITCSAAAKKMRLRCLTHLIQALTQQHSQVPLNPEHQKQFQENVLFNLVGEIMLCTKEANGKAREAAFQLLICMAQYMKSVRNGGLMEFIQILMGGLAATTPHMRSAAILSLSRIVYEFGKYERDIRSAMPQLLETVLLLLNEKANEVIKAVIGFLKLGIAILSKSSLEPFLPSIINGLLIWIGESKHRFRAKTRVILIKLLRKYGYETIEKLVPEEDHALLRHIKKTTERGEKKKEMHQSEKAETFDEFMNSSEDEEEIRVNDKESFGNQKTKDKSRSQSSSRKKNRDKGTIVQENEEEIVDFLSSNSGRQQSSQRNQENEDSDGDCAMQFSKDGRLIVPDDRIKDETKENAIDESVIRQDIAQELVKLCLSKRSRADEQHPPGQEYKSKKARGDVRKKGKLEPYAYIPLDPKLMAKRNKRQAVKKYASNVGLRRKRSAK